jgi:hypothetical protein
MPQTAALNANADRVAGFASAACILLILMLTCWLGIWGPATGETLNVIVAVIGWAVTIAIGVVAFVLSARQIKLGRNQLDLQQRQIEMQQQQIAETRQEMRKSNFVRLKKEFQSFAADLDRFKLAPGYLRTFTDRFPKGAIDGWSVALIRARQNAEDSISYSAAAAPFGYGERVATLINRIQRLGDQMLQGSMAGQGFDQATLMRFDPHVMAAIQGMRDLEAEIRGRIPQLDQELLALADERDIYR